MASINSLIPFSGIILPTYSIMNASLLIPNSFLITVFSFSDSFLLNLSISIPFLTTDTSI